MFSIAANDDIATKHYLYVKDKCIEKIKIAETKKYFNTLEDFLGADTKMIKIANEKFEQFLIWLEENLEIIIKAKPPELLRLYEQIKEKFSFDILVTSESKSERVQVFGEKGINGTTVSNQIKEIFCYEKLNKKYKYELTKELDVTICPYCNREFVFTVLDEEGKTVIRPELDHYFPQSLYPMFALSFYNLIPSGHICNSNIKGKQELSIEKHLHPYVDEDKTFSFYMDMKDNQIKNTEIKISPSIEEISASTEEISVSAQKICATIDFFKLRQIYRHHDDVSNKITEIYRKNTPQKIWDYYSKLKDLDEFHCVEDVLNLVFSDFIIKDIDKEILGKLKMDLYKELHDVYIKELEKSRIGKANIHE